MKPIEVKFDKDDNLVRVYPSKKYLPKKESLRCPARFCTKDWLAEKEEKLVRYILRKAQNVQTA